MLPSRRCLLASPGTPCDIPFWLTYGFRSSCPERSRSPFSLSLQDPRSNSLAHHRHARREQSRTELRGASPARSPNGVFTAARIVACGHAACSFDPEPDPRNGLSLTRNGCASQRLHPGVNVPGLPLRIPPGFPPARSVLRLRNPDWFAPAAAASTPQTRFRISAGRCRPSPAPPLPFGTVTSLQIKAFTPVQSTDPLAGRARFPFAPRRRFLLDCRLRIIVPGSLRFRKLANLAEPSDFSFIILISVRLMAP
jgi:hypothetical protein